MDVAFWTMIGTWFSGMGMMVAVIVSLFLATRTQKVKIKLEFIPTTLILNNSITSVYTSLTVSNIGDKSNSWFNELVNYASSIGMPGIGYITLMEDKSFKGPIDKFLNNEERDSIIKLCDMKPNDVLFFIADKMKQIASKQAGLIRIELGKKLNLIKNDCFELCIITDFPMYEFKDGKYEFCHNPFNMPKCSLEELTKENMGNIIANQYDFVCNGNEMASGAVRNHDIAIMERLFELVGYSKETVVERFRSLHTAFHYGVPPHAGMALGIDRIIMLLKDENNLREVQAFPMSVSGVDNMMNSPSELTEDQLRELHIKIR